METTLIKRKLSKIQPDTVTRQPFHAVLHEKLNPPTPRRSSFDFDPMIYSEFGFAWLRFDGVSSLDLLTILDW
jgi:hypothetical protein